MWHLTIVSVRRTTDTGRNLIVVRLDPKVLRWLRAMAEEGIAFTSQPSSGCQRESVVLSDATNVQESLDTLTPRVGARATGGR